MLILSLDTAIQSVSLALIQDGKIIAKLSRDMERGQGEALIPMIIELMEKAGYKMGELDAVSVSVGPGSFTGVRVGLAAARGIGLALHIPVYGMSTLSALAYQSKGEVIALIDTKRGDFYTQKFFDGKEIEDAVIRSKEQLQSMLPFVGVSLDEDGNEIGCDIYKPEMTIAEVIGLAAQTQSLPPEPLYLRDADVSFPKSR